MGEYAEENVHFVSLFKVFRMRWKLFRLMNLQFTLCCAGAAIPNRMSVATHPGAINSVSGPNRRQYWGWSHLSAGLPFCQCISHEISGNHCHKEENPVFLASIFSSTEVLLCTAGGVLDRQHSWQLELCGGSWPQLAQLWRSVAMIPSHSTGSSLSDSCHLHLQPPPSLLQTTWNTFQQFQEMTESRDHS